MTAGRPPVPAERKRKLGNPGKRDLPSLASVAPVAGVVTAPPEQLGPEGRALWDHVVAGCVWLAETDRPTLVLLCEKQDRRADFKRLLAESEAVLFTDKGYAYANPVIGMLSTIETEIAKLYSALGLTPTDRTRMGVAEVKAKNAFEEMLARRKGAE
jgi:P27 family predicted phage terminase small subunit